MVGLPSASFARLLANFANSVDRNLISFAALFLASIVCVQDVAWQALGAVINSASTLVTVLGTVLTCSSFWKEDLSFLLTLLGADFSFRVVPHVRLARSTSGRRASAGLARAIALNTLIFNENRNVRRAGLNTVFVEYIRVASFLVTGFASIHSVLASEAVVLTGLAHVLGRVFELPSWATFQALVSEEVKVVIDTASHTSGRSTVTLQACRIARITL